MLVIDHVRKSFGRVVAIGDVSVRIGDGASFGLLGPNGAGKTTMMRMTLGIMAPDAGTITWNDASIDERTREKFGYLPEERGLYGKMRVRDHIVYFARLHALPKADAERAADTWIERLDLGTYAQRPCAELSKGNQQKVQVACAAVHRPELLILDEPFTGLDPVNAAILSELLLEMRRNGTTLVLSSHEMWQLERLCTDFCIVAQGTVRERGTLAELRARWPTLRVRVAPKDDVMRAAMEQLAQARLLENEDEAAIYELRRTTDCAALLRKLVESGPVTSFERIEPSLQELYLHALGTERQ